MKTTWVTDNAWTSPDGKVTIWKIKLEDSAGQRGDYNTMSQAIATMGWAGDIEMYTNDKGKEYVRQEHKEDAAVAGGGKSTWQPRNDKQITINMVWKNMLQWFDVKKLLTDPHEKQIFWQSIQEHTDELLALGSIEIVEDKPVQKKVEESRQMNRWPTSDLPPLQDDEIPAEYR